MNAGVAKFAPMDQSSPEMFDEQFNVNVRGAYFTAKHAAPLIADGGAILFTASMVTSIAEPMSSVYSATKSAIRSFGRSLASELAPKIRVNTISPGPIETPIFGKLGMPSEVIQAFAADMMQRNLPEFDLAFVQHLNQGGPRNVEHVGCFLGGQFGVNRDDRNGVSAAHFVEDSDQHLEGGSGEHHCFIVGRSDDPKPKRGLRSQPGGQQTACFLGLFGLGRRG